MVSANTHKRSSSAAPFILERWSPRAFVPSDIAETELLALLEAGRWAPSAYNRQPWRFIYARRSTPEWERFLSLLVPFNRAWAEHASAVVYVASHRTIKDEKTGVPQDNPTHAFDAGAASLLIQLQAFHEGWVAHPVSGFDHEAAQRQFNVPEEYVLHAALIIGRLGEKQSLPEYLQSKEQLSDRLPLANVAFSGAWPEADAS
ncbi:nitroreductase family protein [Acetobacter cibinongensis]|uniref:Nitroreductase n=1 Tax=Acetobacter cibinongensis TaxID=146475 RepID=A0A1Z5YVS8_9PROT|nr:nitroreductase family protein [Acetobacter cibinongensis]OUJ03030.1 nitroreductase [Acetobacter cibinongensis]